MDSIDTQDFIDKTLAEIKLSGILDNSHEITIFTSYFRPAYTCFSYITNDKGNDFFIPYLPTTQISGGILSEYSFARMLLGEEDTYNLIEELCNRIAQSKHINVKTSIIHMLYLIFGVMSFSLPVQHIYIHDLKKI